MMFSATMPKQMSELADAYLKNPVRVEVAPQGKAADKVEQSVHFVEQPAKVAMLIAHLDKHRDETALVFSRTKHGAEKLMKKLVNAGFAASSIHGNKSQGHRDRAIRELKSGEIRVLVATDVAARGIDIPGIAFVYNYDLPNVAEHYVHRIGRTARAGRSGHSVTFCSPDEMSELEQIQKFMKVEIPVASGQRWASTKKPAKKPQRGRARGRPQNRRAA